MFEQGRNSQLLIISAISALAAGTYTDSAGVTAALKANAIPGITDFGYDHEMGVERRGAGQFGQNKPVGITDEYAGLKGSFDCEGSVGETAVLAAINKKVRATFVNGNYNKLFPFFILANVTDDDGNALRAHFLDTCKVDAVPKKIGPDAKRFSFQGIIGNDFAGKKLRFHIKDGAATPVTNIPLPTGETAAAWTDEDGTSRYAVLVLRLSSSGTQKRLYVASAAASGYYADASGVLTLHADDGLAVGDKLLAAYLV